jgi:hypothetical protein
MKEEIEQIRKESNNKIYYIIFDDHKRVEEEIRSNYDMGLITFHERLKQIKELNEFTLKKFKSNGITEYIY